MAPAGGRVRHLSDLRTVTFVTLIVCPEGWSGAVLRRTVPLLAVSDKQTGAAMGNEKRDAESRPPQDERRPDVQDQQEPESDDVAGHVYTGALKEQAPG